MSYLPLWPMKSPSILTSTLHLKSVSSFGPGRFQLTSTNLLNSFQPPLPGSLPERVGGSPQEGP